MREKGRRINMDFEKLRENLEKTKDVVVAKSMDVARVTKLKISLANEESKLKKIYCEIGALMHELRYKEVNNDAEIEQKLEECDKIKEKMDAIEEELGKEDGIRCAHCGKVNSTDAVFCNYCGERVVITDRSANNDDGSNDGSPDGE